MSAIKKLLCASAAAIMIFPVSGCAHKKAVSPTEIEVWHYYNSIQLQKLSELAEEFNSSIGREKGIVVTVQHKGSLAEIHDMIRQSAQNEVGSAALPTIFSAYADTAFDLSNRGLLADMSSFLTNSEREIYISEYLKEGEFRSDGSLLLWPVAKATEVLMINKTDWLPFAEKYGLTTDDLSTFEGITAVAEKYYEYTDCMTDEPYDGKAFFGRDSVSNYMMIGSMQLKNVILSGDNGKAVINLDKAVMRRLWDNYYVPYVKGFFTAGGRFRSDDAKTGEIIAFIGSTSGAGYYPTEVTRTDGTSYPIEPIVLPAPHFDGGEHYAVQQGAGMAVINSDSKKVAAAMEFLKWFTSPEQNLRFTVQTGYLPVRQDANSEKLLQKMLSDNIITLPDVVSQTISAGIETTNNNIMYTGDVFERSYELRMILDTSLQQAAENDRAAFEAALAEGRDRNEVLSLFITDDRFEQWYDYISHELYESAK